MPNKVVIPFLIAIAVSIASGQGISTFAGNGTAGYSGDGGPATQAAINRVVGLAADVDGNIYLAEEKNNRVRKVSTSGVITTLAGSGTAGFSGDGGPAAQAQLNGPLGVCVAPSGVIYVNDQGNHRVRAISPAGTISTVAGSSSTVNSGDGGPATSAGMVIPIRCAVDQSGNLFIVDQGAHVIRKVNTSNGIITTFAGVANVPGFSGDGGSATQAAMNNPTAASFDAAGNLYVTDQFNQRIRKIATNGIITTVAGNGTTAFAGDGGPATSASLYYPGETVIDSAGNLFIVDTVNQVIRKVAGGTISTVAGTAGAAGYAGDGGAPLQAKFSNAFAIALDNGGNLYVGDIDNNRVRKITGLAAVTSSTSQPYYFSHLAFGNGFQSTLTYINYSPQAVTCTTNFYTNAGGPLSIPFSQGTVASRTDTLQPGQSLHDQTTANLTAPVAEGWAQASCTGPVQASLLFRYYVNGVAASEAGVNAETVPTSSFVTFAQTATGVAYANPSTTQSATVTFTVINSAGSTLGSKSITLGPLAHGSANLGPLLSLSSFTGSVKITSTIPIISLSLNFEAFPVFSSLPPGDLPGGFGGGGGPASYYFSQLAFGGGFQMNLTLINYSPQAVTCTTAFYTDSGAPLLVPFGQGTISTRTDILPAGGSIHDLTAASLTAAVAQGWAQSSCTGPVQASLLYRLYSSGVATSEAGVTAEAAPTTVFATFAETATGVAYANPSATQSATITFTIYSSTGTNLGSRVITLGPLAHGSANLGPLLGLPRFAGFVKITSSIPIISLSLNFEAFPVFSSLPPGDLPGSTPLVTP